MMAVKNPECPICQETFKDGRGLSGHLQFKHDLSGEEHKEKLKKGMDRGRKRKMPAPSEVGGNTGRSIRDRELELKGMLREVEEEKEEIRGGALLWILSSEEEERLEELERREEKIREELQKLQGEGE